MRKLITLCIFLTISITFCFCTVEAGVLNIQVSKLSLGLSPDTTLPNRILLKFEVPEFLSECRIDFAELCFNSSMDTTQQSVLNIAVYPVTSDWIENDTLSAENVTYIDSVFNFIGTCDTIPENSMDITDIVEAWVKGSVSNKGLVLMPLHKPTAALQVMPLAPNLIAEVKIYYTAPVKRE